MVIRNSLIVLLSKKPIAKVTVTEICESAGINRATFYAHYSDPFDLLRSIEEEMMSDITTGLGDAFSKTSANLQETLTWLFEYISENEEICRVLISDSSDTSFQVKVVSMLQERFIDEWTAGKSVTAEEAQYLYTFAAIGSVGMIRKWLADGMKRSPCEMAELVVKLSKEGFSAF
jgi:AcrR family transcriptional regulator